MGTDYTRGHHVLQLNNGLTLVHHELAATPVVVADIWIKAGAGMEPLEWTGMAHFLEHMIFKGTPTLAPGLFDYLVEAQGGMTNAATSHDYVHFFITIAADRFAYALPHLADLLLHAAIPVDEFNLERQVVLEEIRQAEDDPDWLAFQVMAEQVYPNHPYGRSILGSAATLEPLSPSEMRCFYQTYYQPEHMTVVITGGISLEQTVEIVSQAFQDFPEPSACPPPP
jgi:predicted Zn-dependent peptidase